MLLPQPFRLQRGCRLRRHSLLRKLASRASAIAAPAHFLCPAHCCSSKIGAAALIFCQCCRCTRAIFAPALLLCCCAGPVAAQARHFPLLLVYQRSGCDFSPGCYCVCAVVALVLLLHLPYRCSWAFVAAAQSMHWHYRCAGAFVGTAPELFSPDLTTSLCVGIAHSMHCTLFPDCLHLLCCLRIAHLSMIQRMHTARITNCQ